MKKNTLLIVLLLVFAALTVGLFGPFLGSQTCNGNDCFSVGPFSSPNPNPGPGGGASSQTSVQIVFSGKVTFADGTSAPLKQNTNLASLVTGPGGKAVSSETLGISVQVTGVTTFKLRVVGFVNEVVYRPSSDALGSYYSQVSQVAWSGGAGNLYSMSPTGAPIPLANYSHSAQDFITFGDYPAAHANATHYWYTLTGALNLTLGTPFNKTVPSIFSGWPNTPINIALGNAPGTNPVSGPGGCGSANAKCLAIMSPTTQGVRASWYVLGAFPAFSVVNSRNSRSIMKELGIL